jgi:lipopolysaccharide transport system ATP-binding protein
MYVRLAFAVAAHLEPEVLIVDEVLAVGDSEFQKKCLGKMKDVAGHGRTVLFVSHNMAAVRALCEKALLLIDGRLTRAGETAEVILAYADQQTDASGFSRPPRQTAKPHIIDASVVEVIEVKGTHQRLLKLRITAHSAKAMNVEIAARIRDGFGGSVGFAPVGSLMSESPAQLDMGSTTFEMSIDVSRLALGQYMLSLELTKTVRGDLRLLRGLSIL